LFKISEETKEYMINIRRKIHSNPELGFEEFETQKLIINELEKLGIKYKKIKTGVIADIGDENSKNCIAFRADMDALPVEEETHLDYSSKIDGKMHACGHDNHIAILLGFAKELVKIKSEMNGKIRLIFQPNEEGQNGSKTLVKAGILEGVKAIFGLHVKTDLEVSKIGLKYGSIMASVDEFKIILKGKGGHGAIPHKATDSILLGSQIVQSLNCIVSRNINPVNPAVLSVCKFVAGTTFNVIPSQCEMQGTIRSFDKETRDIICEQLKQIVEKFCKVQNVEFEIEINNMNPALINDDNLVSSLKDVILKSDFFDKENLIMLKEPSMGGEDFAEYLKYIPGCYFYLGAGNVEKNCIYDWHHPKFNVDEDCLEYGALTFLSIAKNLDFFINSLS
jgi:amidohydrolase